MCREKGLNGNGHFFKSITKGERESVSRESMVPRRRLWNESRSCFSPIIIPIGSTVHTLRLDGQCQRVILQENRLVLIRKKMQ